MLTLRSLKFLPVLALTLLARASAMDTAPAPSTPPYGQLRSLSQYIQAQRRETRIPAAMLAEWGIKTDQTHLTALQIALEPDANRRRLGALLVNVPGSTRPVLVLIERHTDAEGRFVRGGTFRVDENGALVHASSRVGDTVSYPSVSDATADFNSRVEYWRGWVEETNRRLAANSSSGSSR